MEPRISLVTLGVEDVERAVAFYRALGMPTLDWESDDAAFFSLEGTWLALYRRDLLAEEIHARPEGGGAGDADTEGEVGEGNPVDDAPTNAFGGFALAHNVESEAAVDAVLDDAAAAGADVVQPGVDRDWGGYSGYFADPDGHHWEVAWNPHFEIG